MDFPTEPGGIRKSLFLFFGGFENRGFDSQPNWGFGAKNPEAIWWGPTYGCLAGSDRNYTPEETHMEHNLT